MFGREAPHAVSHPRDEISFHHLDIPLELLLLLHLQSRFLRTPPKGSGFMMRGIGLGAEET